LELQEAKFGGAGAEGTAVPAGSEVWNPNFARTFDFSYEGTCT
jgi:hypothetical protein